MIKHSFQCFFGFKFYGSNVQASTLRTFCFMEVKKKKNWVVWCMEKERARDRSVQMVTQWVLWLLALWDYFFFGEGSGAQMASDAAL